MTRAAAGLLVASAALGTGCAAPRAYPPAPVEMLRGYLIVIPGRTPLDDALASLFEQGGFPVGREVRGGRHPAAALIHFVFRPEGAAGAASLYVRLADTRSGVVVAAVQVSLDSVGPSPRLQAQAVLEALRAP